MMTPTENPADADFNGVAQALLGSSLVDSVVLRLRMALSAALRGAGFEVAPEVAASRVTPGEQLAIRCDFFEVTDPLRAEVFYVMAGLAIQESVDSAPLLYVSASVTNPRNATDVVATKFLVSDWTGAGAVMGPAGWVYLRTLLEGLATQPHESEGEKFAWLAAEMSTELAP